MKYIRKSSKEEGNIAMFNFAKKRVNKLVEKAESGDLEAQYQLGYNYDKGIDVKVDKKQAWYWVAESAKGGFAEAQATLSAFILRDFNDDSSLLLEAFSFAQASADQGNGFGLSMLGRFYGDGLVVEEDLDKSLELYKAAYKKGFTKARMMIREIEMYNFKKRLTSRA